MGGGVRCRGGGIASLLGVLRDHGEAVEYDLLRCGLRLDWLGTPRLSWHDLSVLVRHAQRGTAIYAALTGAESLRTPELELLRSLEHTARVLVWQQTRDGERGRNFPKPAGLPWDDPDPSRPDEMSLAETFAFLGWEISDEVAAWLAQQPESQAN